MKPTNRLDHVVWIVRPENIERYVDEATQLFGVEFERLNDPSREGSFKDIFISFDGGLEFIAPLAPGDLMSRKYLEFLDHHGEGLYGLVFAVADINESIGHARELGYAATDMLQSPDPSVRRRYLATYTQRCIDAQEAHIGTMVGTEVIFGEFEYPQRYDNQFMADASGSDAPREPLGPSAS